MRRPHIPPAVVTEVRNTIRTFALVCVAITSIFVMAMIIWLTRLLSDPSWCDRAIGAAKDASQRASAFGGCFSLLTQQMAALATNSFIFGGCVALCLAALMIIVVAGGKISFSGNKDGVSANISGAGDAPPPNTPVVATTTTTTTAVQVDGDAPSPASPRPAGPEGAM